MIQVKYPCFCILFSFLFFTTVVYCFKPIVDTRFGQIQGITSKVSEFSYEAFLGIPYAEPPIGDLQFAPTVPFNLTWTAPYDGTYFRSTCLSASFSGSPIINSSLDCLYLNIWRPVKSFDETGDRKLLPVLYFIHGGAYVFGSGSDSTNQGNVIAATQNIIVVTSNYRLGAFGFLYGHPEKMPGNQGILDVITAIKWIRDNIESFGGDPNQITISGQSAGSMIISLISAVPTLPSGLYQRQFMMSGAAVHSMFIDDKSVALAKVKLTAEKCGCGSTPESALELPLNVIKCLKNVDPQKLLVIQMSPDVAILGGSSLFSTYPVFGTDLIPDPIVYSNVRVPKALEIIIGNDQDEPSIFIPKIDAKTLDQAYIYLENQLKIVKKDLTKEQMDYFFELYFSEIIDNDIVKLRAKIIEFVQDFGWFCPSLILSKAYSLNNRVQFYVNSYVGDNLVKGSRPWGTMHGDELLFFFGEPLKNVDKYSKRDREYSEFTLKLLGNFVKGEKFIDWPIIDFDPKKSVKAQIIKNLTLMSSYFEDNHGLICAEWSELLNFSITNLY